MSIDKLDTVHWIIYARDENRLRSFARRNYLGDSAVTIRRLLDIVEGAKINDEMIEAGAQAAFWEDDMGGHIEGRWTWDTIPDEGRENYRKMVRATLVAALTSTTGGR